MGDFIGFTFGDKSTSELGITRVSGGDRYEEELQPEIKDITAEVPGGNGEYYFGSTYGPRKIDIEVAFDHLTEVQFKELRRVFGTKDIKELIFDERPYKKYLAKLESPIELSYVCFDEPKRTVGTTRNGVRVTNRTYTPTSEVTVSNEELEATVNLTTFQTQLQDDGSYSFVYSDADSSWMYGEDEVDLATYGVECTGTPEDGDIITIVVTTVTTLTYEQVTPYQYSDSTERIYKGEGKMSFVCYFPFAKSVYKQLPTGMEEGDWAISSGILTATEYASIDKYNTESGIINVYNGGDIEAGFRLYLPAAAATTSTTLAYKSNSMEAEPTASLVLNAMTLKTDDIGVLIDTVNELVIGVKPQTIMVNGQQVQVGVTYDNSGNAMYFTSGNIYNKYVDSGYFFHLQPNDKYDGATIQVTGGAQGIEIFYDYLYF